MKADSIIFDLDGTLWDSIEPVTESWNQIIEKRLGREYFITPQDIHDCMGLIMEDIGKKLFPQLPREEMLSILQECCEYENEYVTKTGGTLFEGLEETLEVLSQKMPLFIVSNCQAGYIEAFFEAHGTQKYIKDYENPGRTGFPKAENIRLIVERNQLKHPIYVGDTKGDFDSATKAGVPFVFARYGFGEVDETACAGCIDRFSELKEIETWIE